jgi:hypothetical protein
MATTPGRSMPPTRPCLPKDFTRLTERYGVRYAIVAASQPVPGRELYRNRSYKVVALPPP